MRSNAGGYCDWVWTYAEGEFVSGGLLRGRYSPEADNKGDDVVELYRVSRYSWINSHVTTDDLPCERHQP